jgi:23S rRNA (cytosine1962-C5)-methyltransferase
VGAGFFNEHSKIRVRMISRNTNDRFDEAFFERRLRHAIDYRRTVMGTDFFRLPACFRRSGFFSGVYRGQV